MSEKQLFEPFSEEQQAEYEKEAMRLYDPATVKASNDLWKSYSAEKKKNILDEAGDIYLDIVKAMPKGADSPEAQSGIARWRKNMENFWVPADEQLIGLVEGYSSDLRFKATFDKIHPDLAAFMLEAVKIFVKIRKQK